MDVWGKSVDLAGLTPSPGYESMYLPLQKVADTSFHIQGDDNFTQCCFNAGTSYDTSLALNHIRVALYYNYTYSLLPECLWYMSCIYKYRTLSHINKPSWKYEYEYEYESYQLLKMLIYHYDIIIIIIIGVYSTKKTCSQKAEELSFYIKKLNTKIYMMRY